MWSYLCSNWIIECWQNEFWWDNWLLFDLFNWKTEDVRRKAAPPWQSNHSWIILVKFEVKNAYVDGLLSKFHWNRKFQVLTFCSAKISAIWLGCSKCWNTAPPISPIIAIEDKQSSCFVTETGISGLEEESTLNLHSCFNNSYRVS